MNLWCLDMRGHQGTDHNPEYVQWVEGGREEAARRSESYNTHIDISTPRVQRSRGATARTVFVPGFLPVPPTFRYLLLQHLPILIGLRKQSRELMPRTSSSAQLRSLHQPVQI